MRLYLKRRLALFSNHSFRSACLMSFCAAIGVGMTYIALGWHILSIYNNMIAIIIFMFTWWIFATLLSPLTGYVADRFPRRHVVLISNTLRVALILIYLIIGSFDSLVKIYLFTTLWGIILAFFMPAMLIFVRELFESDHVLMYANSTMDGIFEIGMVIGMSLGGLLITLYSMHDLLYLLLFLMLISLFASIGIYPKRQVEKGHGNFIQDWAEVINYLKDNRFVFWYYVAQICFNSLFMIVPAFLAPYAKNILHAGAFEFGIIETSFSLGFVIGTFVMPWFADRQGEVKVIIFALLMSAILYVLLASVHHVGFAVLCYFFAGISVSCWAIIVTLAQKNTLITLQGKAQGVAYGISGLIVMLVYLLFLIIESSHSLPANDWFYFTLVIALFTLIPLYKGHHLHQKSHGKKASA